MRQLLWMFLRRSFDVCCGFITQSERDNESREHWITNAERRPTTLSGSGRGQKPNKEIIELG